MMPLNIGKGRCKGTARILIRPNEDAVDLGAAHDVLSSAFAAVHHYNRHADMDDFIAVAFPGMRKGRNITLPGYDLELIASEGAFDVFLKLDGIKKLTRRGMIEEIYASEVFFDEGEVGAAYVRDQSLQKKSEGRMRRELARAERRKEHIAKRRGSIQEIREKPKEKKVEPPLFFRMGNAVLHIREIKGIYTSSPIEVTTYGLSSVGSPSILPVLPDSLREN